MINRRNFLKVIGLLAAVPTLVLTVTKKVAKTITTRRLLSTLDLRYFATGRRRLEPVEINGTKYYVMMLHPQQEYDLRVLVARDKYKHEQWVKRFNKWRASRGEAPHQEINGEIGTFEGVRFKDIA